MDVNVGCGKEGYAGVGGRYISPSSGTRCSDLKCSMYTSSITQIVSSRLKKRLEFGDQTHAWHVSTAQVPPFFAPPPIAIGINAVPKEMLNCD